MVAGFVLVVGRNLIEGFDAASVSVEPGWLFAAALAALGAVFSQMLAWRSLLSRMSGTNPRLLDAACVYFDSQLARYTPGKVGLLAVRIAGAPRLGVPGRLLLSSLLLELSSWTGVGLFVGLSLVTLGLQPGNADAARVRDFLSTLSTTSTVLAILALVGLTLLSTVPRQAWPSWLTRLLIGEAAAPQHASLPLAPGVLVFWHAVHWLGWAVTGALLAFSLGGTWATAVTSGGVLCLAVVLGFLAIVAPAGAGVREAVTAGLLTPLLGPSSALTLSLIARALSLGADVLSWSLARAVSFAEARQARGPAR